MKNDNNIHIIQYGSGPEVWVGLHGWNGKAQTFDVLRNHIPAHVTFLSLDLPGYGESAAPSEWTLAAVAGQIDVALRRRIGDSPFSLLGSCGGAIVGLYVARAAGARLRRFVCLEPFAFLPWYLRLFMWPIVGWIFYWSSFGTRFGRALTNRAMAKHRHAQTDMLASFAGAPLIVPYRYLALFNQIEASDQFDDLPGRKTLICGERTFEAIHESIDTWHRVWPDADRLRIPQAGHLVLLEAPERLAHAVFAAEPPLSAQPPAQHSPSRKLPSERSL
jgi:pimeloyl-ACP methyl ester carboxylesterase